MLIQAAEKIGAECSELIDADHGRFEQYPLMALYKLNDQATLVEATCWRAAYNAASFYVVMDNTLSKVQSVVGEATEYENAIISGSWKSRGIGDCWNGKSFVWDGTTFVQANAFHTGLCEGYGGGFWHRPTYVSEVQ